MAQAGTSIRPTLADRLPGSIQSEENFDKMNEKNEERYYS